MNYDELLWAINSVAEQQPCDTVGHWSCSKALRAIVKLHRPSGGWFCGECTAPNEEVIYPCPTIQAIEKEFI